MADSQELAVRDKRSWGSCQSAFKTDLSASKLTVLVTLTD